MIHVLSLSVILVTVWAAIAAWSHPVEMAVPPALIHAHVSSVARGVADMPRSDPDDLNGDGRVTEIERRKMRAFRAEVAATLARLDRNGDGVVDRDEYLAPFIAAFTRSDIDDDGRLKPAELADLLRPPAKP